MYHINDVVKVNINLKKKKQSKRREENGRDSRRRQSWRIYAVSLYALLSPHIHLLGWMQAGKIILKIYLIKFDFQHIPRLRVFCSFFLFYLFFLSVNSMRLALTFICRFCKLTNGFLYISTFSHIYIYI